MPGLANFIIDHINRGIAGDIAGQAQQGQLSPADAAAAYTQETGLPADNLFAGVQQSALAKLAADPAFASMAPQDQLSALAKLGNLGVIPAMQEMAVNRAYGQALTGGAPASPPQNGSIGDTQPRAPVPQTLPGQASGPGVQSSPLASLTGILNQGLNPAPVMNMVKTQADLGKTAADTAQANSAVAKNAADADLARTNAQKAVFEMGGNPGVASPVAQGTVRPLSLYTRIQAAENAAGDPGATGDGGKATGLMQTHPAAFAEGAAYAGLQNPDPKNPAHQMLAGQGYLQKQLDTFQDPVRATIAYNAGPSVAAGWDGNIASLPEQTQAYLGKVFPEMGGSGAGEGPISPKAAMEAQTSGAKKSAEESAGNAEGVRKNLALMTSQVPLVRQQFNDMVSANQASNFNPLANDEEGEGKGLKVYNAYENPAASAANARLKQLAAQNVLREIGPQLSQNGTRGNKFLESIIAGGAGLDLESTKDSRAQQIGGLRTNYSRGLMSVLDQAKEYGIDPTPYVKQAFPDPHAVKGAVQDGFLDKPSGLKLLKEYWGM